MNSTKSYFLYALLLFTVLLFISHIDYRLEVIAKEQYNFWEWLTITQFLYISIGVVLAIPHLIKNRKEKSMWKIDYKKLLLFGLPSMYLTFSFTLHVYIKIPYFIMTTSSLFKIAAILLGYIVATSFYKVSNDH
jgi:hypothetical protein